MKNRDLYRRKREFWTRRRWVRLIGIIAVLLLIGIAWLLFGSPRVQSMTPIDGGDGVALDQEIRINFDRPIKRAGLTLLVDPKVEGQWTFSNHLIHDRWYRTITFKPDNIYTANTQYRVAIEGVHGMWGNQPSQRLEMIFTTVGVPAEPVALEEDQPSTSPSNQSSPNQNRASPRNTTRPNQDAALTEVVMLNVPVHFQEQPLSCEAAALKMALNYKGTPVSESVIMGIVGIDDRPRVNNVWGDPNQTFVGSITGKQNSTGYGVHWGPIARAANHYRPSEAFSGWGVGDLAREIQNGNSVVIWGTYGNGRPDSWTTPEGKEIRAWHGEHTRTVIGFRGSVDNPAGFVLNDPLSGRINWTTTQLLGNWGHFGNSGVVVR